MHSSCLPNFKGIAPSAAFADCVNNCLYLNNLHHYGAKKVITGDLKKFSYPG